MAFVFLGIKINLDYGPINPWKFRVFVFLLLLLLVGCLSK